jgi:hypothetical protein
VLAIWFDRRDVGQTLAATSTCLFLDVTSILKIALSWSMAGRPSIQFDDSPIAQKKGALLAGPQLPSTSYGPQWPAGDFFGGSPAIKLQPRKTLGLVWFAKNAIPLPFLACVFWAKTGQWRWFLDLIYSSLASWWLNQILVLAFYIPISFRPIVCVFWLSPPLFGSTIWFQNPCWLMISSGIKSYPRYPKILGIIIIQERGIPINQPCFM